MHNERISPPHPLVLRVPFLSSLMIKLRYFSECKHLILGINYRTTLRMKCQIQETKLVTVSEHPLDHQTPLPESFIPVLLLQSQVFPNLAQQTLNVWHFLWFRIINYGAGRNLQSSQGWQQKVYFQVLSQSIDRIGKLWCQVLNIDMQDPHWLLAKGRFLPFVFPQSISQHSHWFSSDEQGWWWGKMPNMENRGFV